MINTALFSSLARYTYKTISYFRHSREIGNPVYYRIKKSILWSLALIPIVLTCWHIWLNSRYGQVQVISVSSDGQYAISTNDSRGVVLWNIKDKTSKVIDYPANIYSAYFIHNTHNFMWQNDKTNEIYIQSINGEIIKHFNPKFPTYGQVINNNLSNYYANDEDGYLYGFKNDKQIFKTKVPYGSFLGSQKLINLYLNKDRLLATSFVDVMLYTLSGKPIHDYQKNVSKTTAIFSPDGKYIISGDENSNLFTINTSIGKIQKAWLICCGKAIAYNKYGAITKFDTTGLIKRPNDFKWPWMTQYKELAGSNVLAMKFIDGTHFLRFTTNVPYAILYKLGNPKPLKYINLGKNPMPSVTDYTRDQSIDTSWKNHILVMGKAWDNGIIVYRYVPKTQTLKKIWQPSGSFWYAMRQWFEQLKKLNIAE